MDGPAARIGVIAGNVKGDCSDRPRASLAKGRRVAGIDEQIAVDHGNIPVGGIQKCIGSALGQYEDSRLEGPADGDGTRRDWKIVLGKDRAETFGQVVLHDHFHIICLPGKDSRVGRRVHGDRGSGAVVVKAVGCGQTQSGALCGVFFLACCHAILGEIYLKQAGRGCQGRSICCRLGVTPLLQHAPAVHADRKHADEHNQTDKHPDCYSSSPCGLAGNDRMDQHAWTLRQLKIWTESPSSVPRKTSVSRWCSAN